MDREIFLKILTMDDEGAWQRGKGEIPVVTWRAAAPPEIQDEYFGTCGFKQGLSDEEREEAFAQIWESLTGDQQQALDAQRLRLGRRSTPTSQPLLTVYRNSSSSSGNAPSATRPASVIAFAAAVPSPSRPPASVARPSVPTSIPLPGFLPGPALTCLAAAKRFRKK
jgi:hypothetical protein